MDQKLITHFLFLIYPILEKITLNIKKFIFKISKRNKQEKFFFSRVYRSNFYLKKKYLNKNNIKAF